MLAKKLLLSLIATALGLLLLEVGARVLYSAYRKRPFDRVEVSGRLLAGPSPDTIEEVDPAREEQDELARSGITRQPAIIHPYFGYVFNPAWRGINQYGFFGRELFATRGSDTLIVGLFGGSVADHLFRSAASDVLVDVLQEHPPFSDKRIELFNTAVAAYKQPQQLLVLATLLALGAQFDIVINLDGFNEIDAAKDNVQDGVNPFYPHLWKLFVRKLSDSAAAMHIGKAHEIRADRETLRRWFAAWPVVHSAFLLTLWDFLDQRQVAALRAETLALQQALAQSAATPQASGPPIAFPDDETMYREFTEVWARGSLEMSILCRGMGIRYFQFLQPNQYLPGAKTLTAEERELAYDPDVADTQRVATGYPMLIERGRELAQQGVNFVDLTNIFRDEPRTVYIDTCCHLNDLGNARLATEIARAVVHHYAAEEGGPEEQRSGEGEANR